MSDLKLLEDLLALAQTGSFVRAAEMRHVTHPAFGRRIRALETWAGAPLVFRHRQPVELTPAGEALLKTGSQVVAQLNQVRQRITHVGHDGAVLRVATGRSLARTLVTDWIARLRQRRPRVLPSDAEVEIFTGRTEDLAVRLERQGTDFLCCYEHPAMSVRLDTVRFRYMTLGTDKAVPVCQANRQGKPRFTLPEDGKPVPLIAFSEGLAMQRIVADRIAGLPYVLTPVARLDSLDVAHSAALKGFGVAWLPWSMVAGDCRAGRLATVGGRSEEVSFEIRLYRARSRLSDVAEAVWHATQTGVVP